MGGEEMRDEVRLTNLDQPLFDEAEATKRQLVDYLDAARDRILPELRGWPLSVVRVLRGQQPFMQKNLPKYAPQWLHRVTLWAESSQREVAYALCEDRRSLLWFANQRAVEYHPTLVRAERWHRPTHLVLDIDPPAGSPFRTAISAARLVAQALAEVGMAGAVKTSGAKGLHVFVPITDTPVDDAAAATRALAARPGTPVSFPVDWEDLDQVTPADFTLRNATALLADSDPWAEMVPAPQPVAPVLVEEGHQIPVARVQAMHEGKRRARARRAAADDAGEDRP